MSTYETVGPTSPYLELARPEWSRLATNTEVPLTAEEIRRIQGLGDRIDDVEVREVYLPLSRLLNLHAAAAQHLHSTTSIFLGEAREPTPYVIGVAGSVAAGKSTTARILSELMSRWPETPRVELVTTDGFLYPNAVLEERGLMQRKGFPESYDRRALLRFIIDVKAGVPEVTVPVYSHLTYDIVPDEENVVRRPDVLIVEGLNVLQPARPATQAESIDSLAVSDFFDYSVYVHARVEYLRQWYIDRFLALRATAFADPASYFHRYASLSDAEAVERAASIWHDVNEANLLENVRPSRARARLILSKGPEHNVKSVYMRKI